MSVTLHGRELLGHEPSNYVDGRFLAIPGNDIESHDPAVPTHLVWAGAEHPAHADDAIAAARRALPEWSARSLEERVEVLRRWQSVTKKHAERVARLITMEMGKTIAESRFEANALGGKVDITLGDESFSRVTDYVVAAGETRDGHCRFKPHGVMAVIGPFNFPAHLPNGHWVPALLMGNTVVFKPSEKTAAVGQLMAELMDEAGVPAGVFNMVQGGGALASRLVADHHVDGVLFTGSWPVGRRILEVNLSQPGKIIALELGGSNPAVVMPSANLRQAVIECVRASFATTGQRCTCTRRIIVHESIADAFIGLFCRAASTLLVGPGDDEGAQLPPAFMGPLVSEQSADDAIEFQEELVRAGGSILVQATRLDRPGHFVTPGVVQVDRFTRESDRECFGPIVRIATTASLDDAIDQANDSEYGLAASIFTGERAEYEAFFHRCRAGCINWNCGTAGASSKLPFGGLGHSGNHRPAGAFSLDYCAIPVASMVEKGADAPVPTGMMIDENWFS